MLNGRAGRLLAVAASTVAVAGVAAATLGGGALAKTSKTKGPRTAHATVVDAKGRHVGRVTFEQRRGSKIVTVSARVRGLPPGFHGFHIHGVGHCNHDGFDHAGSHLNPAGATHPDHAGDLPVLLAQRNGRAVASFQTDRFSIGDLRDEDGSAVIVHEKPDNYANIPTDRYDPDPDEATLGTGDAGSRIACGIVR